MIINKKAVYLICSILLSLFLVLGCQLTIRPTLTGVSTPTRVGSLTGASTPTGVGTPTAAPLTGKDAIHTPVAAETATPGARDPTATPSSQPTSTPAPVKVPENNELRLYSPDDAETLDPALVQDMTSHRFVSLLFSGLVTLDSDLQVVPDLAERWEVDDSGTIYTFYLHEDARFHDGTPVTAQDVVYSIDRAADPERGSVKRAQSYLDDIVGVLDRTSGKAGSISGLKALDDHTVQITIDAPKPYFLAKLTYPTSFVVNKENVEQTRTKWTAHPIGTGPFKMAENGHTQMVLDAFDDYHRGRPNLDRLTFVYRGQSMNLYERGELDVIEIGAEYIDRVLDPNDPLHDDLRIVSQVDVWYIGFNVAKPPFDDRHVRRAFAYATNKVAIAEIALNKMVLPAKGILPPGVPGYNPDLEGLSYNAQRALDEMVQSEYGDATELPPITLTVTGPETGEMLAEMYKQTLGVDIQVQVVDWGEFLSGLDAQEYQMFSLGWIGDYPDPQNFLDMLFHSQSAYNHSAYSNPDLDALVEQARVEQDTDKRLTLYQQAEQILVEDAPWIPLYHSGGYYLVRPYVRDLAISAQETMNLHEVSIGAP
jgi:oligopeptide transport system substrate-binding protein